MGIDYYLIGKIGLINLSVLMGVTTVRFYRWYEQWDNPETWKNPIFKKRFVFHVLLLLATAVDLPMYVSFVMYGEYSLTAYAFHKLESASLFAALSITISDWSTVLHDIHEYDVSHFFLRKVSLIVINTVYFLISFLNFIICFTLENLDVYLTTPYYTTGIFFQISVSFLLTTLMLHAGLKLYARISGAAGTTTSSPSLSLPPNSNGLGQRLKIPAQFFRLMNDGLALIPRDSSGSGKRGGERERDRERAPSHLALTSTSSSSVQSLSHSNTSVHTSTLSSLLRNPLGARDDEHHFDGTAEFRHALFNLNLVMLACTLCIFLQMMMLMLNYALGYADEANRTPGPYLFYWTCYSWIPMWGPICALLYLCRTQSARRKQKQLTSQMMSTLSLSQPSMSSGTTPTLSTAARERDRERDGAAMTANPLISSRTSADYHFNRASSADLRFAERARQRGMLSQVFSDDVESCVITALRKDLALSRFNENGREDTEDELYEEEEEEGNDFEDQEMRDYAANRAFVDNARNSGAVTILPSQTAEKRQSQREREREGETATPSSQAGERHTPYREHDPLRVILSQSLNLSASHSLSLSQSAPPALSPFLSLSHSQRASSPLTTQQNTGTGTTARLHSSERVYSHEYSMEDERDQSYSHGSEDAMRIILGRDRERERAMRRAGGASFDTDVSRDENQDRDGDGALSCYDSSFHGTATTTATHLPSEMFFPNFHGDDQQDFSYRGEEVQNGRFFR